MAPGRGCPATTTMAGTSAGSSIRVTTSGKIEKRARQRLRSLEKKIHELSVLYGVEACLIYLPPYGETQQSNPTTVWPKDEGSIHSTIHRYQSYCAKKEGGAIKTMMMKTKVQTKKTSRPDYLELLSSLCNGSYNSASSNGVEAQAAVAGECAGKAENRGLSSGSMDFGPKTPEEALQIHHAMVQTGGAPAYNSFYDGDDELNLRMADEDFEYLPSLDDLRCAFSNTLSEGQALVQKDCDFHSFDDAYVGDHHPYIDLEMVVALEDLLPSLEDSVSTPSDSTSRGLEGVNKVMTVETGYGGGASNSFSGDDAYRNMDAIFEDLPSLDDHRCAPSNIVASFSLEDLLAQTHCAFNSFSDIDGEDHPSLGEDLSNSHSTQSKATSCGLEEVLPKNPVMVHTGCVDDICGPKMDDAFRFLQPLDESCSLREGLPAGNQVMVRTDCSFYCSCSKYVDPEFDWKMCTFSGSL